MQGREKQGGDVLVYSKHPCEPALCGKISRMPVGLRELLLHQKLSAQFIYALGGAENLGQKEDDGSTFAIATSVDRLLKIPRLKNLERLLALTLLGYLLYSKGNLKLTVMRLQAHVRLLPARRTAGSQWKMPLTERL